MSAIPSDTNLQDTEPGGLLTEADFAPAPAEACTEVGFNDTTRRFPRTLSEAFRDADYAASLERTLDWIDKRWPMWFVLAGMAGAAAGVLAVFWGK